MQRHRALQARALVVLSLILAAAPALARVPAAESGTGPLQFTSGGHVLGFTSKDLTVATGSHALRVEFVGASGVVPEADGAAATSNDKGAPLGRVAYPGLWDGITLAYDAPAGALVRSTYTVAPGADPAQIRLRYNAPLRVEPGGGLRVALAAGAMRESAPVAWQDLEGRRVPVAVAFRAVSGSEVGFSVGDYDRSRPLTIDPTLFWETLLGGAGDEEARGVAVDGSGNVYVTGFSSATWGSPIRAHSGSTDVFVAKLDPAGALLWNTFLGGAGIDYGFGIAVDAAGGVSVTGSSDATWGSPVKAFMGSYTWSGDAFVARLDTQGALLWNTFFGEYDIDCGWAVTVDDGGNSFVTGVSGHTWGDPPDTHVDAFVAKFGADGALGWVTYLGQGAGGEGTAISRDSSGHIFVAGRSYSSWGTPVIPPSGSGPYAFVVKLESDGSVLWNTFFAGGPSMVKGLALDPNGNVYVTGVSWNVWGSPTFSYPGDEYWMHWYVAKLDAGGNLQWNTFLGESFGIAADASGNVYLAGWDIYTWGNLVRPYQGPTRADACVTKIDTDGALVWNAYFGGTSIDVFQGVALDAGGGIFLAGARDATSGAEYPTRLLGGDAYVVALPSSFGSGAPTLDAIGDLAIDEDAGEQTVGLTGITAGPGEIQPLTVTATSSNTGVIPHPAVTYASPESTGTLVFTPVAGTHGLATITVTVDDGQSTNNTVVRTFVVTVNAVNHAPTDILLSNATVVDTAPAGTPVGTLSTTDPDPGNAFTYTLVDGAGDNGSFEIVGDELRILAPLDFSAKNPLFVHVVSTDLAGASTQKAFAVSPAVYVLWTRGDSGRAALWQVDAGLPTGKDQLKRNVALHPSSGVGGPWQAASYAHVSATEGYVLWTRNDTGQAVLWEIDPSLPAGEGQRKRMVPLYSTAGVGGPWQATSYAHVSATEGYVLWTRSDTGRAVLWQVDPSLPTGKEQVKRMVSLYSTAGIGGPWQATSYTHVSTTEGYVLWTRSDNGRAVLWQIDPSLPTGKEQVTRMNSLYSTAGVGAPWQASSYTHVSATEGYVLWTRSDNGRAVLWQVDPSLPTGKDQSKRMVSLYSASGIGGPWQASSLFRIGPVTPAPADARVPTEEE